MHVAWNKICDYSIHSLGEVSNSTKCFSFNQTRNMKTKRTLFALCAVSAFSIGSVFAGEGCPGCPGHEEVTEIPVAAPEEVVKNAAEQQTINLKITGMH